ncbi:MAG: RNA polymerase factor sigma-54 [Spirochaetia bacterium]|nr:RNA polymerase factor sigma-54 [Spirochaetia bacterium]
MQLQKPVLAQEQRQKLSPQMIQSIRLMALPVAELKEQIVAEVEANPALEVVEDRSEVSLESFPEERETEAAEQMFDTASDPGFAGSSRRDDDAKRMFMEGSIAEAESLQDHLLWQLRLQPISAKAREIGEALIRNLDDDGFNRTDPFGLVTELFAREDALRLAEDTKAVIGVIRSLEPVGCCTADYRESLLSQAELDPDAPEPVLAVLRDHVELLEKGKHEEIRKRLKLDEDGLAELLAYVKRLNPFPGRLFSKSEPRFVIPDLLVKLKDGEFVIVLNDEEIPVLGINPFFDRLTEEKHDKSTDAFVKDNVRRARFFIQSLHQRNKTLLKVAKAVVEFQRAFFGKGPKHLAPLTLKDVAREVGVHETTVSRIANRKYVQTDWGIFELRYFFTNSISGAGSGGSRFSKEGVKQVIKELIGEETAVMSDQDIADLLARRGIKLARRTVAKYRQELNMDSSFGRRHV